MLGNSIVRNQLGPEDSRTIFEGYISKLRLKQSEKRHRDGDEDGGVSGSGDDDGHRKHRKRSSRKHDRASDEEEDEDRKSRKSSRKKDKKDKKDKRGERSRSASPTDAGARV